MLTCGHVTASLKLEVFQRREDVMPSAIGLQIHPRRIPGGRKQTTRMTITLKDRDGMRFKGKARVELYNSRGIKIAERDLKRGEMTWRVKIPEKEGTYTYKAVCESLSAVASLATMFGSFLGMMIRRPGPRWMAFALGFSAGVMMFVSFGELLRVGIDDVGFVPATIAFFVGMGLMFVIDTLVPHRFIAEQANKQACDDEEVADAGGPGNDTRLTLIAPGENRLLGADSGITTMDPIKIK